MAPCLSFQTVYSNQFSVTKHSKIVNALGDSGLPGVFVMYELSPMMVKYTEKQRFVLQLLLTLDISPHRDCLFTK